MKLLLQLLILAIIFTTLVNGQFVQLNYYNYQNDQSCNGEIISTTYNRESTCLDGTEYVCVGNEVQINYYRDSNCTQGIFQQLTQENGVCQGALTFNCVDNYQFVENSIITIISETCDDWKNTPDSILSQPLNKCIINPSESATVFTCTSDSITTSTYPSNDNCNGTPSNFTQTLPECDTKFTKYAYNHICNQ
ncbi:hypothetical protein ACTFIY_003492 [Dictyostelium cf. discoideum]